MSTQGATNLDQIALANHGRGVDLCRVTVHGADGRADLAIPTVATIGLLIPVLAEYVDRSQGQRAWVLQRAGEPPLAPAATPETADLRDGDVLYLRPAEDPLPELTYDDLAVGVAEAIAARGDHWRPESTRRVLIGLSSFAALLLAATVVLAGGPGGLISLYCGVIAVLFGAGAVAVDRRVEDRLLSLVGGLGACGFAALAGLTGVQNVADVFAPDATGVLVAGICAAAVAAAIGVITRGGIEVYATVVLLGCALIAGSLLVTAASEDLAASVTIVAVGFFLGGTLGPRCAARLARLPVPNLPRTTEELQQDIDPVAGSVIAGRATAANGYLTSVVVAGAIVSIVDAVVVVRGTGWISWVLPVLFAIASLLRARSLRSVWQRGSAMWAGTLMLAAVVLSYGFSLTPIGRIGLLVALLFAAALLVVGAWRLPTARLRPVWGQLAETFELWTAIALVPLLLVLTGTYAYFRALAG